MEGIWHGNFYAGGKRLSRKDKYVGRQIVLLSKENLIKS